MQSKHFSRLSTLTIALATAGVLYWIAREAAQKVPFPPLEGPAATSTPLSPVPASPSLDIRAPLGTIHASISSTTAALERGLSGRDPLPTDEGMLFVYPDAGVRGFWMKDMRFSIDMVWISADRRVAGVTRGASPDSYPRVFYPSAPVQYVLELDSGGADKWGIATGTQLVF